MVESPKTGKKIVGYALLLEGVIIVLQGLVGAIILRTFLFQPFSIPSSSMKSTLLINDYLFVSKYSYGYSRYSFPFALPLFSGRVWQKDPQRGDVVVFRSPRDSKVDYIKRVIGIPGDRIQILNGILYINGEAVEKEYVDLFEERNKKEGQVSSVERYREKLPNGVIYFVLDDSSRDTGSNSEEYLVPAGHYFVLGDNRSNSLDSRVPLWEGGIGFVPEENFLGRARIIFFSMDEGDKFWQIWKWPWSVRWERLLKSVNE